MFQNKDTNRPHTAKWATIISGIGGIIVLICAGLGKYTGLTWETAIPFAILLFGVGGVGLNAMRNRNGGG